MNIICRKTGCKFNQNFVCQAKEIDVSKKAECQTFEPTPISPPDTSKNLYQKPPKYNKHRSAETLPITCTAKCQFNNDGRCHANGITINDVHECPLCITFFKKIK